MSPDEVMRKPRFVRIFILKSMEVQLEDEAAARRRREQAMQEARSRRRR